MYADRKITVDPIGRMIRTMSCCISSLAFEGQLSRNGSRPSKVDVRVLYQLLFLSYILKPTYGLRCSSFIVKPTLYLGSCKGTPKTGTTMETMGKPQKNKKARTSRFPIEY